MVGIHESHVLLRAQTELPTGFKLATDEFHEGWKRIRTGGARRLERKIQTRGWNFVQIADESLRSGVGDTSQKAIANALKLALRRVGAHSNAVEVKRIELKQYPWFFLATVRVLPYRIQEGAAQSLADEAAAPPTAARRSRLPSSAAVRYPQFSSVMPLFKEMLTESTSSSAGGQ
jgi:hypothetical protein